MKKNIIPEKMIARIKFFHGELNETNCFMINDNKTLFFFSNEVESIWYWNDYCWFESECYSTPKWYEYFSMLLNEFNSGVQNNSMNKEIKSVSTKSLNVLDIIAQLSNDEFAQLPLDVRLKLITNLVRSDSTLKS